MHEYSFFHYSLFSQEDPHHCGSFVLCDSHMTEQILRIMQIDPFQFFLKGSRLHRTALIILPGICIGND